MSRGTGDPPDPRDPMDPDPADPLDPLDPLVRLRALAAALPGAAIAEHTLAATFDQVWPVVADLETMVPRYESNVDAVDVIERRGERARVVVTLRGGHAEEMDVRMAPGWCLMQSESTVVAFAARPAGQQTVLAHLEHDRRRSPSPAPAGNDPASRARPQAASSSAAAHTKLLDELAAIERLVRLRYPISPSHTSPASDTRPSPPPEP